MKFAPSQVCTLKLYKVQSYLVWPFFKDRFSPEKLDYYSLVDNLLIGEFIYQLLFNLQFFFELCYAIDLLITLSNPLYPADKRIKSYFTCFVLYMVAFFVWENRSIKGSFLSFYTDHEVERYSDTLIQYFDDNEMFWKVFLSIPVAALTIFGLIATCKGCASLKDQGIGMKVRKKVIRMQVLFIVTVLICDIPFLVMNVFKFVEGGFTKFLNFDEERRADIQQNF